MTTINNQSALDTIMQNPSLIITCLLIIILSILVTWKLFVKAGIPGWWSIIPIANHYKMFELFWGKGWLFILSFIPIVNIVVGIMFCIKLSNSFGKGAGFSVGLMFLPIIFAPILAFGSSEYIGPGGIAKSTLEATD